MGTWDVSFVNRPDAVTGLQRRTGSYVTEFKGNLQERIIKEHLWEPDDPVPQNNHGVHRMGSAVGYVTELTDPVQPNPTLRPHDPNVAGIPLDDNDIGRILIKDERELYFYKGNVGGWKKIDTTPIGTINIWSGSVPPSDWMICDGSLLQIDEYPVLYSIIGTIYGSETIDDFNIPNLQGLIVMGHGQQDIDTNTKGYTDGIGTIVEDQIQDITGQVGFNPVYPGSNIARDNTGVFELVNDTGGNARRLDRTVGDEDRGGFRLNLSGGGVRVGDYSHPSVMLMNYTIKVS